MILTRENPFALASKLGWLAFFGAVLLAWYFLYAMVRGEANWLCGPDIIAAFSMGGFGALAPMWLVMGAAMMLPTIIPTLRAYQKLPKRAGATTAGFWGLIAGYGAVWIAMGLVFAIVQTAMINSGWVTVTGAATHAWIAAALLIVAGVWQFSRGKEICQTACLSPMSYFTGRFRPGVSGAVVMGVEIGVTCVACCWAIMALGLVGGMTSLLWMGLATAFMVLEKLPEIGLHLRKPAGVILGISGVCVGLFA